MRHARLLSGAAIALASAAIFGACADSSPVSGPKLIDGVNNPMLSSGQPTAGDLTRLNATTRTAQGELVEVCKDYSGGGAMPAVTFDVSVTGSANATDFQVVLNNGECQEIWFNEIPAGENPPTAHDVVTITEQVPAGYSASFVKTSIVGGVQTVDASVDGNEVSGGVFGSNGYLAEFTNAMDVTGCSLTLGYWKTHAEDWDEDADANTASFLTTTTFYNSGLTYLEIMNTPPQGGNAYIQLAHQFIAASLNVGVPTGTTTEVDDALLAADAYFAAAAAGTPAPSGALRTQVQGWASTLASYNEGDIGPGHCED
ncbi:MAG TPA: hypothetical protein VFG84_12220 [Gemmatimonadaceae bacterium]|nr:hypothetical protein [Gemmatimonadaceae bacterium]